MQTTILAGCVPESASYVAVTVPIKIEDDVYRNKYARIVFISINWILSALALVFSDESLHSAAKGWQYNVTFCKVETDATTDTRYFYFRFRRYIYDDNLNKFIPGSFDVTEDTVYGRWLDKSYLHKGLSYEEANKRLGIVGPNVLDLKKPTLLSNIVAEFSKPFYLYQTFMIWIWGKSILLRKTFQLSLKSNVSHLPLQNILSTSLVLFHGDGSYLCSSVGWSCCCILQVYGRQQFVSTVSYRWNC